MHEDGHLLLILHAPPSDDHSEREPRLFWRNDAGAWVSDQLGTGIHSLKEHVADFDERTEHLEDLFDEADSSEDFYALLREVVPLSRTVRNLYATLQDARERSGDDKELISLRDQASDMVRRLDLLHEDIKNGLNFTVAFQSEEQTWRSYEMSVSAHRLNLLAAIFLPTATLASLYGMNLRNGWEDDPSRMPFWAVFAFGIVLGVVTTIMLTRHPTKPTISRTAPKIAEQKDATESAE